MTPFSGTPLYDRLARAGRLVGPTDWQKRTLFDITYRPAQMTAEELRRGFFALAAKVYSPEFVELRRRNFIRRKLELDQRTAA